MEKPGRHRLEDARIETIKGLGLGTPDADRIYEAVVQLVSAALDVPICLLSIVEKDRQFFKAKVGLEDRETSRDISFCGHAILQQPDDSVMVVPDAQADPRFADNPLVTGEPKIRFYAGVQVNAPNNLPVGTVCAIDTKPRELSLKERKLLGSAKLLMEAAISLRSRSTHDHLTGLYNRRHFDSLLEREWRRAYRHAMPLGILIFDVDHFKGYNDRFGHQAGDECLKKVAQAAEAVVSRAGDVMARYGGEEFVAVLPGTDLEATRHVAERVREAVRNLGVEHPGTEAGCVTVSVGGGVLIDRDGLVKGPESLLAVADDALYDAKDGGRDRCVVKALQPDKETPGG